MTDTFSIHISHLQKRYEQALSKMNSLEAILLHSGEEQYYYADDQTAPFRSFGHFSHWLPVNRPEQMLLVRPGQRPVYFQVVPADYWYDQTIEQAHWWAKEFEIVTLSRPEQIAQYLLQGRGLAFLGGTLAFAQSLGIDDAHINPPALLNELDYHRGIKTDYEIQLIKAANQHALNGHAAARKCFLAGGSEYQIHMDYLQACDMSEADCPYTSIVALNQKAAILHYQYKRTSLPPEEKSQVLLIDAGCRINNYCSDITRTSIGTHCHKTFRQLLSGMEALQGRLIEEVKPGLSYVNLHLSAIQQVAELAVQSELILCDTDEAMELGLAGLFMPHGVGHLLGIQVHDVGGHMASADGASNPPPSAYPFLRNTRVMSENMVFTIEPGLYFIPLLLDPERQTERGKRINWALIDELIPLGGMRIEDNVRVTNNAVENLTRLAPD